MADIDRKVAISVKHLTKTFKIPTEASNSLKQKIINSTKGIKGYREFTPLKDISFDIHEGDFFGIVGRNGSGKSTLLKTISEIYRPTKGSVHVNGKLVPFIELGVGFNPELTGRENVYLNGALLGFSHAEMEAMYDDIVDFAEIGEFMDEKLKNYSSGMQVRLAFSIAIKVDTDILVLDEVLAVGDAAFQQKCFDYFMELKRAKKTVVLVTHDMASVKKYCNKAMIIDNGKIKNIGDPDRIASEYHKLFIKAEKRELNNGNQWGDGSVTVNNTIAIVDKDKVNVTTEYVVNKEIINPIFGISIYTQDGTNLIDANTYQHNKKTGKFIQGTRLKIVWSIPNIFTKGLYRISTGVVSEYFSVVYGQVDGSESFRISEDIPTGALVYPKITLSGIDRE